MSDLKPFPVHLLTDEQYRKLCDRRGRLHGNDSGYKVSVSKIEALKDFRDREYPIGKKFTHNGRPMIIDHYRRSSALVTATSDREVDAFDNWLGVPMVETEILDIDDLLQASGYLPARQCVIVESSV